MTAVTSARSGVLGVATLRKEDPPLLTGEARFVNDLDLPGALHMRVVRSPIAHARIASIDTSAAVAMPGVVAVLTGTDFVDDFAAPLPCAWPVTDDMKHPEHWPLTRDEVRFVGDGVAVVVAETPQAAKDAAEAVVVDYDELPVVLDLEDAATDRNLVHTELGSNTSYTWTLAPDAAAVDAAFANAAHTVKERYLQQRLIAMAMESRGVCVVPQPFGGEYTIYLSTQVPHFVKIFMAIMTGIPEHHLRVVAPAVGGAFGSKLDVYAEEALCLAVAKRLGRIIRWNEERSENATVTVQGRGMIQDMELAADADGRITAVRVNLLADMGAYLQIVTPGIPLLGAFLYHGVYDVPAYSFTCTGVFTNRTPTDAYRGAGRPEATYAIERSIDALARKVGIDPVEIRRRNFIPTDKFPYASAPGLLFDSGNYEPALDRALEMLDYEELRADQARRRAAGSTKHLGVGFSSYVEMCGLAPSRVLGVVELRGRRMGGRDRAGLADRQGPGRHRDLPARSGSRDRVVDDRRREARHPDRGHRRVALRHRDRAARAGFLRLALAVRRRHRGRHGHRSSAREGPHDRGAPTRDLRRRLGVRRRRVPGQGQPVAALALGALAFEAFTAHNLPDGMEPNLEGQISWDPPNFTFPFGVHVAVVEIDEETGNVELLRYIAVDDCGNQVNPLIVEGQIHGGIVQGVAQALWEEAVFDEDGNPMNGSLDEYLVPSAAEMPNIELDQTVTPSPTNPLGVKGIGEAGTIASTPAVMNAVVDALSPFGITDIVMPATPGRVWAAIQASRSASTPGGVQ